jgi:hypothetical protein
MRRSACFLAAVGAMSFISPHLRADTYTWIGPDSGEWFTDGNWSSPGAPSTSDDAQFNSGANTLISISSPAINDLSLASGGALTLQSSASVGSISLSVANFDNGGLLTFSSDANVYTDSLIATGAIHNLATGQIVINSLGSIAGTLSNDGVFNVNANTSFTGTFTNQNAIALASNTTLTINNSTFTQSAGTLSGDSSSVVVLNSSTFNYNGGSISAPVNLVSSSLSTPDLGGASTPGTFNFLSTGSLLTNLRQGVVVNVIGNNNVGPVTLAMPADSTISGIVHLTSTDSNWDSAVSALDPSSNDLTNQGSIYADAGTGGNRYINANLSNNATFISTAPLIFSGDVTNTGTMSLAAGQTTSISNHTFSQLTGSLAVNGPLAISSSVFQLGSATQSGGSITGAGPINLNNGSTLRTFADTNVGAVTINFLSNGTLDGNLTAGLTLNVVANSAVGGVALSMPPNSTISGVLHLNSTDSAWDSALSSLDPSDGSYANVTNQGAIYADAGTGGNRYINANLINQSTFIATSPVSFAGDVTNTGTMSLAAGQITSVTNHTFSQLSGSLAVNGPLTFSNSVFQLGSATQPGGSITGAGPINLTNSSTLRTFADTNVGPVTINFIANGTLDGNLSTGLTLNAVANSNVGGVALSMPPNSTISGVLRLNSTDSAWDSALSSLDPSDGSYANVTNQGAIYADAGTGGNRYINANLINQSTFIATSPVIFAGDVTNTGTMSLAAGQITSVTNHTFSQLAGSLAVNGPLTFSDSVFQLGSATQPGGSITGAGPINLTNSSTLRTFADTNVGPVTINFIANGTLDGNLSTGLTLNVVANSSVGDVALSMPANSTISGILHLTSTDSAWDTAVTSFNPSDGTYATLTNQGSLYADLGAGGTRHIEANFVNASSGQFTVSAPTVIPGTLDNTGTITLNDSSSLSVTGNLAQLSAAGDTLTAGTWIFNGTSTFSVPNANATTGITTIGPAASVTLNSAGTLDNTPFYLSTNQGTFNITDGRQFAASASFINSGAVTIASSSQLSTGPSGDYTQTAGTTTLTGGTVAVPAGQSINIQSGTLAGAGTVSGNTTLAGTLSPGNPIGTLHFNNALTLTSAAHTLIDANSATSYDQITVASSAALAGNLAVTLGSGFTPSPSTTLTPLTAGSITGTFTNRRTAAPANGSGLLINYSSTAVTLSSYNQVHWLPNADGDWSTPANWDTDNTLPQPLDDVFLDVGGSTVRTITLSTGTQSINSLTSNENLTLSGGTLSLANASTINGSLTLSGGTLSGAGNFTLNNASNTWSSGTMSGTGKTTIASGATLALNSASYATLSRTLENAGTVNWSTGESLTFDGGTFNNLVGGIFNASGSGNAQNNGGTNAFNNAGTFNKTGTSSITFFVPFNNTGSLSVQAGTLVLIGGTNSGNISVAANSTLNLASSYTYAAGSTLAGAGTIDFGSTHVFPAGAFNPTGTVNFGTASVTLNNSISPASLGPIGGALTLNANQTFDSITLNGGTLQGSGNLTLTGSNTWSSGTMSGTGKTTLAAGATISVATNAGVYLARTMDNAGTFNLAGVQNLMFSSSTLNNLSTGIINVSGSSSFDMSGGFSTLNNAGTFNKTGTSAAGILGGTFSNTDILNVQAGTLSIRSAVSQLPSSTLTAGTWNVSNNATLDLSNSSNITTSAASITLDGANSSFPKLNSLTTNQGSLTITNGRNFTTASGFTSSGTLTLGPSAALTLPAAATYTQTAGTTSLSSATIAGPVNILAGSLTGTGTISGSATVAGTLSPGSPIGTLAFGSNLTLTSSATTNLDLSSSSSDQITVAGATSLAGNLSVSFLSGFTPSPNQSFTLLTSGSAITGSFANAPANSFITVPGSAGRAYLSYAGKSALTLTTAGTVHWNVNAGGDWSTPTNWDINAVPTPAADVVIDRPAGLYTVTVSTGTQAVNSLTSNENLTISGGTLDLAAASTLNSALTFSGGTLQGVGNVTLNGASTWTTGNMSGAGKTTISSTGSLAVTANGGINLSRTLENAGSTSLDGSAGWVFFNGGVFNNLSTGTFSATGPTTIYSGAGSNSFSNAGTLNKSGAATTTSIDVNFSNTGTVNVLSGTLSIGAPIAQIPVSTLSAGTWNVSNNATLDLASIAYVTALAPAAIVKLDGVNSSFPTLDPLDTNQGSLTLLHGRSFTTYASFNNSGTLFIGPTSSFESTGPLTNAGLIDLTSTTLKLDQGVASSTLASQLLSAYNNGSWTGAAGITSSVAAADSTHQTAITYSLTGSTYTLQLGLFGDANLDGKINADDYALIDRGFAKHLTGWTSGDFNYDGVVDQNDYLLIDRAYLLGQAPGFNPGSLLADRDSQFGDAYVSSLLASVPEPSLFSIVLIGLTTGSFRRHRRS